MNLIQIQDRLKSLPNDPRVMQMLTSYANGQNPQVPPYLALGELNRRKGLMEQQQAAAAGQPPAGTVKDQIEQQAGVMALKQGQQQQAMQRMAQQGAMAGGPVPQGIAQPQPQSEAPGMASGGLASLAPKGYRSGGIIAFSEGDLVEGEGELVDELEKTDRELPTDPKALVAELMQEAAKRRNMKVPPREDYLARQSRLIKENPDMLGALAKPIGQDAIARLEELQSGRRAELAKQKEELAGAKPGILQLLGQAAMGTRGQKGGSALASILGGYSELASGADAKQLQQEQALRMKDLDLQQAKADALNKVEEAQRAYAAGNMAKYEADIREGEKIAAKRGVSLDTLLGKQLATAGTLVESQRKADDTTRTLTSRENIAAERRKLDERLEKMRFDRPGEKERILNRLQQLRKNKDVEGEKQLLEDLRYLQGSAVGVNAARNERLIIEAQLKTANNVLTNSRSTPAEIATAKAEIAELNKQLKGLRTKPDSTEESTPKPITGAEFDAKWKTLKKGETLVGPDGNTYTKG